jgi:D-arabinose 1-dehydrogenase-like Zn-dependent alcohol dehydrogenase
MTAAAVRDRSGPFTLEDLRDPEPGPGEILVRIAGWAVCHIDLHVHDGAVADPCPMSGCRCGLAD